MTSTCMRDRDLALHLYAHLSEQSIDHYLFVEDAEYDTFTQNCPVPVSHILHKPNGGDNGFGRPGSVCRWHCHQQMLSIVQSEDTLLQIDSDVRIQNPIAWKALTCRRSEIRGYAGDGLGIAWLHVDGARFAALSGMLIAVQGQVFHDAMTNLSLDELNNIINSISDRAIDNIQAPDRVGACPSEDIVASYLYQVRGRAQHIVDFHPMFSRGGMTCDINYNAAQLREWLQTPR